MAEELAAVPAAETAWMTVAQAARQLGCSERAVRKRIERGRLNARREQDGNRVRTLVAVPVAELHADNDAEHATEQAEELVRTLRELVADLQAERDRLLSLVEKLADERRSLWSEVKTWIVRRLRD